METNELKQRLQDLNQRILQAHKDKDDPFTFINTVEIVRDFDNIIALAFDHNTVLE